MISIGNSCKNLATSHLMYISILTFCIKKYINEKKVEANIILFMKETDCKCVFYEKNIQKFQKAI